MFKSEGFDYKALEKAHLEIEREIYLINNNDEFACAWIMDLKAKIKELESIIERLKCKTNR